VEGGLAVETLFPLEGVYYEVVSFPCGYRYSMPLGVSRRGGRLLFRVFRGAGLLGRLGGGGRLYLLAPSRPEAFLWSLEHRLEESISWSGGCPVPDESLGAWVACEARSLGWEGGALRYECLEPRHLAGQPPAYSRAMGCLVEMLVVVSKLEAGAPLPDLPGGVRGYLEWLAWCVSRSSGGGLEGLARGLLERASRLA